MKKNFLLIFSFFIAIVILSIVKYQNQALIISKSESYKTFIKKQNRSIASYETTKDEFKDAVLNTETEDKAADINPKEQKDNLSKYKTRNNRVLVGDDLDNYTHSSKELEMLNTPNKDWKNLLGQDLLRFQKEDTKVIIKEELPVIKIIDGKGIYLEQVMISYLKKNGDKNYYRALVDSETGMVTETWDRTIHEKKRRKRDDLSPLPLTTLDN